VDVDITVDMDYAHFGKNASKQDRKNYTVVSMTFVEDINFEDNKEAIWKLSKIFFRAYTERRQ